MCAQSIRFFFSIVTLYSALSGVALSQTTDREAGTVKRPEIGACGTGNCTTGSITITNQILSGNLFVTAKGAQGQIIAGSVNIPCNESTGVVIITGGIADPGRTTYHDLGDVDFRAGKDITLTDGFTAQDGCYFHAYIAPEWDRDHPLWNEDFDYTPSTHIDPNNLTTSQKVFLDRWNFTQGNIQDNIEFIEIDDPFIPGKKDNVIVVKVACVSVPGQTATQKIAPRLQMTDYVHLGQEMCGRYDMLVQWPHVEHIHNGATVYNFSQIHSVWLNTHDSPYSDEIDNYERNNGSNAPGVTPGHAPHYFGAQAGSWHTDVTPNPWLNGFEVDPAVSRMPRFDMSYNVISLEWEPDELRFLVNDCVVHRFPNMHANNSGQEGLGGVNYNFARNALKDLAKWVIYMDVSDDLGGCSDAEGIADARLYISYLKVFNRKTP